MPRFISTLLPLASGFFNPLTLFGWVIFAALLGGIVWLSLRSKEYHPLWETRSWWQFLGLLILTVLGNLFIGLYIKPSSLMPPPGYPLETYGAALMIFGAIGWMIAGGILGPIPALILGLIA